MLAESRLRKVLEVVRAFVQDEFPGEVPEWLTIRLVSKRKVRLPLLGPAPAAVSVPAHFPGQGCAGDILTVLREVGTRLSCPEIREEMAERKMTEWSERVVKRWLSWLQEKGLIDHDPKGLPPGYGVTEG